MKNGTHRTDSDISIPSYHTKKKHQGSIKSVLTQKAEELYRPTIITGHNILYYRTKKKKNQVQGSLLPDTTYIIPTKNHINIRHWYHQYHHNIIPSIQRRRIKHTAPAVIQQGIILPYEEEESNVPYRQRITTPSVVVQSQITVQTKKKNQVQQSLPDTKNQVKINIRCWYYHNIILSVQRRRIIPPYRTKTKRKHQVHSTSSCRIVRDQCIHLKKKKSNKSSKRSILDPLQQHPTLR